MKREQADMLRQQCIALQMMLGVTIQMIDSLIGSPFEGSGTQDEREAVEQARGLAFFNRDATADEASEVTPEDVRARMTAGTRTAPDRR